MQGKTMIYLVRHAEAEGNVYRRIQGQYNSFLTPLGKKQLEAVADRFKSIPFEAVITSDLIRAKDTAKCLAHIRKLEVIENQLLREIRMGCWEDRPWGNLAREYPEQMDKFINNIENFSVDGSERIASVKRRMRQAVLDAASQYSGKTILVISHGTAIQALFSDLLGMRLSQVKKKYGSGDNTAVSLLAVAGEDIHVCYVNDASHLDPDISTYFRQKRWRETKKQIEGAYFIPADYDRLKEMGWEPLKIFDVEEVQSMILRLEDWDVGYIILGLDRYKEKYRGRIVYCFIKPRYRNRRLGMQLIGHAVSFFRSMGLNQILISLDEKEASKGFFTKAGFLEAGYKPNEMVMYILQ